MAHLHKNKRVQVLFGALLVAVTAPVSAQLVISGNENKIDLTSGAPRVIPPAAPDSISILDFSSFPPSVRHLNDIPNSVIGPPSNIAITPDRRLALIANSLKLDAANPTNWVPESFVHILDLTAAPPRVIGRVTTGRQPSGVSIAPDGALALVANRADGTVSVLAIRGKEVSSTQTVKVCEPQESVSDVAISPDGTLALARHGRTFRVVDEHSVGRIPEGVAFTSDGKYLVVQCHPDRELWIFSVKGGRLKDSGQRIKVPGMPSSLRASP